MASSSSSKQPGPSSQPPSPSHVVSYEGTPSIIVGSLFAILGFAAYQKTGSRIFLYGGSAIGSANILGGTMIDTGLPQTGHLICAAANMSVFTAGVSRFWSTRRPMPAFPILTLGLASTTYHLFKAQRSDNKNSGS